VTNTLSLAQRRKRNGFVLIKQQGRLQGRACAAPPPPRHRARSLPSASQSWGGSWWLGITESQSRWTNKGYCRVEWQLNSLIFLTKNIHFGDIFSNHLFFWNENCKNTEKLQWCQWPKIYKT
jgi:hypothetical protein